MVVTVIAAVPDVVSLLEQMNMASSTGHAATDRVNVFVSSSSEGAPEAVCIHMELTVYILTVLSHDC